MRTTYDKRTIVSQDLRVYTFGSGTLAPDRDFGRVTSKGSNIFIDPSEISKSASEVSKYVKLFMNSPECLPLVPEAVVCNTSVKSLFSHQKAVRTQPVVDAHANHWRALLNAVFDDKGEIVPPVRATTHVKATTMNPESNGKVCIGRNTSGANHV